MPPPRAGSGKRHVTGDPQTKARPVSDLVLDTTRQNPVRQAGNARPAPPRMWRDYEHRPETFFRDVRRCAPLPECTLKLRRSCGHLYGDLLVCSCVRLQLRALCNMSSVVIISHPGRYGFYPIFGRKVYFYVEAYGKFDYISVVSMAQSGQEKERL